MKDYFEALVVEQVNRALTLKRLIRYPLKYRELAGLAERCTLILNNQIHFLRELQKEINNREENDLRDIFREIRVCTRHIALIEYYGIPPLHYQTDEIGFLNKLMLKINREIKLPLPHPSVCCIATEHYFLNLFTNVIFAPLSESEFMLHLPDFYHEIGHYVLQNRNSELRLEAIKDNYDMAFSFVTNYYEDLLKTKRRESGPEEISMVIERIHSQWKSWLIEFFCDLFALYTVGPAYAWAHLHLTAKHSDDIHELSIASTHKHPSDESRMRLLIFGLEKLGLKKEAEKIVLRWTELARFWGNPKSEYQYAYPDSLLDKICQLILNGMKQSGMSVFSSKDFTFDHGYSVKAMLNEAWKMFWITKQEKFREWEKKNMGTLRQICNNEFD